MKLLLYLRIINYSVVMLPVDGTVKDTSGTRFFGHFSELSSPLPCSTCTFSGSMAVTDSPKDESNLSMIMKKDVFTHFLHRDKLSLPQIIIVPHNNITSSHLVLVETSQFFVNPYEMEASSTLAASLLHLQYLVAISGAMI